MKFENKKKYSKTEVEDKLHEILIEDVGEEYRVLWQADGGGNHVVIAFEEKVPQIVKDLFTAQFMGWRLIKLVCPKGYLEVFHPIKPKDDFDEIQEW